MVCWHAQLKVIWTSFTTSTNCWLLSHDLWKISDAKRCKDHKPLSQPQEHTEKASYQANIVRVLTAFSLSCLPLLSYFFSTARLPPARRHLHAPAGVWTWPCSWFNADWKWTVQHPFRSLQLCPPLLDFKSRFQASVQVFYVHNRHNVTAHASMQFGTAAKCSVDWLLWDFKLYKDIRWHKKFLV